MSTSVLLEELDPFALEILHQCLWAPLSDRKPGKPWTEKHLDYAEPLFQIFKKVAEIDNSGYLETGTGMGLSSLLAALCGFNPVYTVDINFDRIRYAFERSRILLPDPLIRYILADSNEFLPKLNSQSFSLVYVDGQHIGEAPRNDIKNAVRIARVLVLAHDILSDNEEIRSFIRQAIEPYDFLILDKVYSGLVMIRPFAIDRDFFSELTSKFTEYRSS